MLGLSNGLGSLFSCFVVGARFSGSVRSQQRRRLPPLPFRGRSLSLCSCALRFRHPLPSHTEGGIFLLHRACCCRN
eukprot:SAG22_NODE_3436_length_1713_cov_1.796778_2_plen_76_part_00